MKLSVQENIHFSVLETSLSEYIKKNAPILEKITQTRMEKIFGSKIQFERTKEELKYHKASMFFHISLNGDIIGYFVCIPGQYKGSVWINEFYVEEQYRSKGYGTEAMKKMKDILRNKNYTQAALSFVENNPSERLYIRQGFTNKICTDVMCEL